MKKSSILLKKLLTKVSHYLPSYFSNTTFHNLCHSFNSLDYGLSRNVVIRNAYDCESKFI